MKNLIKAMLAVQSVVKGMEKNSNVGGGGFGSYKGTKDEDVKVVFNEQFTKNGLIIVPIDIDEETKIERWEENGKQKQSVFTKVKVKYQVYHESGESMQIVGYGHGVDSQDKGAGKATTYALKYALLYSFLTPVGKIDDSDTHHSEEITVPKTQATPKKKLEDKNIDNLVAWSVENGKTIKDLETSVEMTLVQKAELVQKLKEAYKLKNLSPDYEQ